MTPPNTQGDDGASFIHRMKQEAVRRLAHRRNVDLELPAVAHASGTDTDHVRQYFPNEDDLLTALILDAYNAMGENAEEGDRKAEAAGGRLLDRWVAVCRGVRRWALDHRDEYALIWGQPVPGYSAPPETMVAGARTVLVLLALLREAQKNGELAEHQDDPPLSDGMLCNVELLASGLLNGLPHRVIARMYVVWTQLHGMVGFEVYGHIVGVAADPAAFFDYAAAAMGEYVGLSR